MENRFNNLVFYKKFSNIRGFFVMVEGVFWVVGLNSSS